MGFNKCPGVIFQKLVCPGGILSLLFYGGVFLLSGIAHSGFSHDGRLMVVPTKLYSGHLSMHFSQQQKSRSPKQKAAGM